MYLVWGSRCELIHHGDAAEGRATNCNIPIRFQEQTPSLCIGGEVNLLLACLHELSEFFLGFRMTVHCSVLAAVGAISVLVA